MCPTPVTVFTRDDELRPGKNPDLVRGPCGRPVLRETTGRRLISSTQGFQKTFGLPAQTLKGVTPGWDHDRNPSCSIAPVVRGIRQQLGFVSTCG